MSTRDPALIGFEWCAWWALQGDEPLHFVRDAALDLGERLDQLGTRLHEAGDIEGSNIVAAARLYNSAISELLDEDGTSEFKVIIQRRKAGKPMNKFARARKGRRAGEIARKLIAEGVKTESAVQSAVDKTGLSRAEVFAWLKSNRAAVDMGDRARKEMADPKRKPKFVE